MSLLGFVFNIKTAHKTHGTPYLGLGWGGAGGQYPRDVLLGIILNVKICTQANVSSLHPKQGLGIKCQNIFERNFFKCPHQHRSHV